MTTEELSKWLGNLHGEVEQTNQQFPNNLVAGWPIPFFGDLLHARVLTVGVNPSDKEFNPTRRWNEVTSFAQWQTRLLGYFQNDEVRPWIWFETWSICLSLLDLGYAGGGAAHIDVSPRPTIPMLSPTTNSDEFRNMVECDVKWFFDLLNRLPQVQLLLVAGPIPRATGRKQQLADFIREQAGMHSAEWTLGNPLPRLLLSSRPEGIPVFICPYEPEVDGLFAMIRQVSRNRPLLGQLSAPGKNAAPIVPGRSDWPSMIGLFLINFGTLDYFVFCFLKDHLSVEEFGKTKEWHFKDRLIRIAQHMQEAKFSQQQQKEFAQLVARLEPIRELRNHIAHGHMYVGFDEETRQSTVTVFKAKDVDTGFDPEAKHVDFAELLAGLNTLNELIEQFQRLTEFKEAETL